MDDVLDPAPTGTTGEGEGLPAAPDDLRAQDPAPTDAQDPTEALPDDLEAARREIQELRSLKGRLGNDKGQLKARNEELERLLVERQATPQPQQQAQPSEEEQLAPYVEAVSAEVWQHLDDLGWETNPKADGYQQTVEEFQRRLIPAAKRERQRDLRAEERAYQRVAPLVAPVLYERNLQQALRTAGFSDVTTADLEETVSDWARANGVDPQQAKAGLATQDAASLHMLALAARGRKAAAAPPSPKPTAKPQDAVQAGPGAAGAPARAMSAQERQYREMAGAMNMPPESVERIVANMLAKGR